MEQRVMYKRKQPHPGLQDRKEVLLQDKKISHKIRIATPMILYTLFYLAVFFLVERTPGRRYTVIRTEIDLLIPFCEIFVLPYLSWFAYCFFFVVYMWKADERSYFRICTWFMAGMTVFLVVSILFPNIQTLRPAVMPRDNIFTRMIAVLYKVDTPTNVTPSIHVYNSIGVMLTAVSSEAGVFRKRFWRIAAVVQGLLIILSTMLIKQHSFSDVTAAVCLSAAVCLLVLRLEKAAEPGMRPQRRKRTTPAWN